MGLCVAVFIIISGIGLVKETVGPLLGQAPSKEMYEMIENKILSIFLFTLYIDFYRKKK